MACIIFTAPYAQEGEYACFPRQSKNFSVNEDWLPSMHPVVAIAGSNRTKYDVCHIYENYQDRLPNSTTNEEGDHGSIADHYSSKIVACDRFVHTSPFNSLVTQFDLVCGRFINLAWIQFWHLFGVLVGGIVAAFLLESYEQKTKLRTLSFCVTVVVAAEIQIELIIPASAHAR